MRDFQNPPRGFPNSNFPGAATLLASGLPVLNASLNTTCNVTNSSVAVNLPPVFRSDLPAAGSTAGLTPFQINLDGCTFPASPGVPYNTFAFFSFTPGANASHIANTATSPAANVTAQILNGNTMVPIQNAQSMSITIPSAGSHAIPLYARYLSTGAAGSGQYRGQVAFELAYF
jgi:major type 1 subunit fimbrin (pilin)